MSPPHYVVEVRQDSSGYYYVVLVGEDVVRVSYARNFTHQAALKKGNKWVSNHAP